MPGPVRTLHDYTHASNAFRRDGYGYSPKFKHAFHVYFDVNPNVYTMPTNTNLALLVKSIKLPSFDISVNEHNQYNRKRLTQSKIKYQPTEIVFLDDNANIVKNLWMNYYAYYYGDTRNIGQTIQNGPPNMSQYNQRTQYTSTQDITDSGTWGYQVENIKGVNTGVKVPFFRNIVIYSMYKRPISFGAKELVSHFTSYTLINPLITNFRHDTASYNESGTMENGMSINYEFVSYADGIIDVNNPGIQVSGFASDGRYDKGDDPKSRQSSTSDQTAKQSNEQIVPGYRKSEIQFNIADQYRLVEQSLQDPNSQINNIVATQNLLNTTTNNFNSFTNRPFNFPRGPII